MGRGGKRGGGRGRGRGGEGGMRRDNRVSYDKVEKMNEKLERYYNTILNLSEDEKPAFWEALRRDLPNSFRFAGSKAHAITVQRLLRERYIPEITKIEHFDGSKVEAPLPVPWYPDELAWSMTTPKNVIRRFPPFAAFQKYLVSETSVGNISRQEVVSMIPPLLMDIKPGMTVLDMCAAPGSKAAQLLEMVHDGEEVRVHQYLRKHAQEDGREANIDGSEISSSADRPTGENLDANSSDYGRAIGLLIANDSDYKRSHMLVHQLKRLSSPNLIVTNHDATIFPSIKLPASKENPSRNRYLKFDRILADVPCSGDGTCRKNLNLWKDWGPGNALGLHITQVRILVRALQMLKAGGRVVYSTCSMNPIENEAVIASVIKSFGGLTKVQLLDCSDRLPLLKRNPGLHRWQVMDKSGQMWNDWTSVTDEIEQKGSNQATERLAEGMFAPVSEPTEEIPLERCMRVYAHQQDTGGFFIAVLQKMTEIQAKPKSEAKKMQAVSNSISNIDKTIVSPPLEDGGNLSPVIKTVDTLPVPPVGNKTDVSTPPGQVEEIFKTDSHNGVKRALEDHNDDEFLISPKKLKPESIDEVSEIHMENERVSPGGELGLKVPSGDRSGDSTPVNPPLRNSQPNRIKKGGQQFEEPFKYISGEHSEVKTIESFYHLNPRFPRDRFMVRNATGEPAKTIYYTSALIRDILVENEGKGIKFIHGGVRMFMKQDVQAEGVCRWRIQSEGMPILEGYVGEERVVSLYKKETLRKLLIEMFPKVTDGGWKNLGEIGERVRDIEMGCCVLRVEPSDHEDGFDQRLVLPLWRSLYSLNLMLAKEERSAMLLRIFNDSTPLVNNHNPGKQQAAGRRENPADPELVLDSMLGDGDVKADDEAHAIEGNAATDKDPVEFDEREDVEAAKFGRGEALRNSIGGVEEHVDSVL